MRGKAYLHNPKQRRVSAEQLVYTGQMAAPTLLGLHANCQRDLNIVDMDNIQTGHFASYLRPRPGPQR